MSPKMTILVGTVGQGVLRSTDDGETWDVVGVGDGIRNGTVVRTMASHPAQPDRIFAGMDGGLFRSDDAGGSWAPVESPLNGMCVWSLAIDPEDPQLMMAGTGTPNPVLLFRSTDGGLTWRQRPLKVVDECDAVGVPRVTAIAIDPVDRANAWMGIEVDGVRRSRDGGESWQSINGGIPNPDIHSVVVVPGPPKTVLVVASDDIYSSTDDGVTWSSLHIKETFPWSYPRSIKVCPNDPRTVFLTIGDTTPGQIGTVMRSQDGGATWAALSLPVQPNAAMWTVSVQPSDPALVFAASRYGYLYRSDDSGDTWRKLWREFSEISSVVWVPA